jgi:hypothetical protein
MQANAEFGSPLISYPHCRCCGMTRRLDRLYIKRHLPSSTELVANCMRAQLTEGNHRYPQLSLSFRFYTSRRAYYVQEVQVDARIGVSNGLQMCSMDDCGKRWMMIRMLSHSILVMTPIDPLYD